jgi:ABC-type transporter Mla MlaB component
VPAARLGRLALVLAGAVAVWLAAARHDLVEARRRLEEARTSLAGVAARPASLETATGRRAALGSLAEAAGEIDAAGRRLRRSWALQPVRLLPGLARQRAGLLELVADARAAVGAGRRLLARADALAAANRVRGGTVPLEGLGRLEAEVTRAAARLRGLVRSPDGLWGGLADARRAFDATAGRTAARLSDAGAVLDAAVGFFGADGPRRYLVAIQNNAEMRDQGIVLSYAVLEADRGQLRLLRRGRITDLALDRPVAVAVPAGTAHVFGFLEPTTLWQSVNATADFPLSARVMTAMYRQATGEDLDGVVAVDVPGLAALLEVLGPVRVEGIAEPIDAANAARILLHDLYAAVPRTGQAERYERLADVTAAVFDALVGADLDAIELGRSLAGAVAGGHLRLFATRPAEERAFSRVGLGGGPARELADRTFHVAVENRTAAKLDYYVTVGIRQHVVVTDLGTALVRTTVAVENRAPVGAAPSYQLGPDGYFTRRPGEYWAWVLHWGPRGALQLGAAEDAGLLVRDRILEVQAGERREATFETVIPRAVRGGVLRLRWVPQPRLVPQQLEVTVEWRGGRARWAGALDATRTLRFQVGRGR